MSVGDDDDDDDDHVTVVVMVVRCWIAKVGAMQRNAKLQCVWGPVLLTPTDNGYL